MLIFVHCVKINGGVHILGDLSPGNGQRSTGPIDEPCAPDHRNGPLMRVTVAS